MAVRCIFSNSLFSAHHSHSIYHPTLLISNVHSPAFWNPFCSSESKFTSLCSRQGRSAEKWLVPGRPAFAFSAQGLARGSRHVLWLADSLLTCGRHWEDICILESPTRMVKVLSVDFCHLPPVPWGKDTGVFCLSSPFFCFLHCYIQIHLLLALEFLASWSLLLKI